MYRCLQADTDGHCPREQTRLSVLSRDYTVSEVEMKTFQKYIAFMSVCIQEDYFVKYYPGMVCLVLVTLAIRIQCSSVVEVPG